MSTKENEELTRQVFKGWNELAEGEAKIRSFFDRCYTSGFTYHLVNRDDMGKEQFIQFLIGVSTAFPDFNCSIDDMVAEGDKVVCRYSFQGTNKGPFRGLPATGKHFTATGVAIEKIKEGKIAEAWDFPDYFGMLTQLGIIPSITPKK